MSSASSAHWPLYDSAPQPDHPASNHYSYSPLSDAARANPSIPRRMSYHSPTDSSSPFAYSPPAPIHSAYSSASYSVPSYNNSSSPTLYSSHPSSYSSSHSAAPASSYFSTSYSSESAASPLEYSHSSSINPAYIGGRHAASHASSQQQQPSPPHIPRVAGRTPPAANDGVQGVLYPARTQYTDNATDKETSWLKRQCHVCRATSPPGWRKSVLKQGKIVCNACGLYEKTHHRPRPTRLSDESRNGVHRRVSSSGTTGTTPTYTGPDLSVREGYSQQQPQSHSSSQGPAQRSPVQYASAYPSTTTSQSSPQMRQGSGPTPPGRSSTISSVSSRSPSSS